jgi:hypothetical protein
LLQYSSHFLSPMAPVPGRSAITTPPPLSPTRTGRLPGPPGTVRLPAPALATTVCICKTITVVLMLNRPNACRALELENSLMCRWCLWIQEREPAAVLVHDVLRQPAPVQGRQGLRVLLPGRLICPCRLSCPVGNGKSIVNLVKDSFCLSPLFFYQIRCVNHPACSGNPETVIITDMNYDPVATYHFDLSGTAFGAMAKAGRNDELRHAGIIDMQFKRWVTWAPRGTDPLQRPNCWS